MQYGYLRETQESAIKAGLNSDGICRTGLDAYLKLIFPDITDWIHDKITGNTKLGKLRPDYRSESLKLIVEFDGIQHYQNSTQIIKDKINSEKYIAEGYKVVRIPWFIQLTKNTIKELFGVNINDATVKLLDENITSFSKEANIENMSVEGIRRCVNDFIGFKDQFYSNLLKLHELKISNFVLNYFYKIAKLDYPDFNTRTVCLLGIKKSKGGRPDQGYKENDCVIRSIHLITRKPYTEIKKKLDDLYLILDECKYNKKYSNEFEGYPMPVIEYYMNSLGYKYIDFTDNYYFEHLESLTFDIIPGKAILCCPNHCVAYKNGYVYELNGENSEDLYFYDIEGIFIKVEDKYDWYFYNQYLKTTTL